MLTIEKSKYSKTLKIKIDNEEIEQIHYENIDDLCENLKFIFTHNEEFSEELLKKEEE